MEKDRGGRRRRRSRREREKEREYNTSSLKSLVYLGTLSTVCLLHSSAPFKNIVACEKDGHSKKRYEREREKGGENEREREKINV